jgi:hypothetical protein
MTEPDREVPLVDDDDIVVLPDQTVDDTDAGWGERSDEDSAEARLLADRPPHWDR